MFAPPTAIYTPRSRFKIFSSEITILNDFLVGKNNVYDVHYKNSLFSLHLLKNMDVRAILVFDWLKL